MMRPESIFHHLNHANSSTVKHLKSIDRKEFDRFCKEYIFDIIKGDSFGVSFCKRFGILDYLLLYTYKNDYDKAVKHIIKTGYLNDSRSN